ncbi:MAG: transglutaminase-like domain-containing protein [Oscillospiraceae bacterium]|jgi:transglutaminase-like putative cysteine protease|nr:transglutaminase-like domain-containing protein [Oscillospiraceae bacterium]
MRIRRIFCSLLALLAVAVPLSLTACNPEQTEGRSADDDSYTGLLKTCPNFLPSSPGIRPVIDFGGETLPQLREAYGLAAVAGELSSARTTFSQATALLHWVSRHTVHDGAYDNHVPENAPELLAYAFDKGADGALNCRALSVILTECLLSLGIPARTVSLMPFSPYDNDNHVIAHAYIGELGKWVVLDPTWDAYPMDERGVPLGLLELRALLAARQPIQFNAEANYNGAPMDAANTAYYTAYLTKDLFYFSFSETSGFGDQGNPRTLTLCPAGYDVKRRELNNIAWRMETFGGSEAMQAWLTRQKAREILYVSAEDFLAAPALAYTIVD